MVLKATCPCGQPIRVYIFKKGVALDVWEVACQNHQNTHLKIILGNIHVTGEPSSLDVAAGIVRRAIRDNVPVVRTSEYEPFTSRARFLNGQGR